MPRLELTRSVTVQPAGIEDVLGVCSCPVSTICDPTPSLWLARRTIARARCLRQPDS